MIARDSRISSFLTHLGMSPPPDVDALCAAELKSLVCSFWRSGATSANCCCAADEIARLKGGSGRPNIKPSGMDRRPSRSLRKTMACAAGAAGRERS